MTTTIENLIETVAMELALIAAEAGRPRGTITRREAWAIPEVLRELNRARARRILSAAGRNSDVREVKS